MDPNLEYYRRRAAEERVRAAAASDAMVRRAHQTMAERYERITAGETPTLGIVERG